MPPGAASLNSNVIRDGHPACRLKPASPPVPAASAKDENNKNNDDKRLGIHDVQPFQYDGFSGAPQHRSLLQLVHEMLGMLLMLLEELEAGFQ